jgi:hypothetical protein
MVATGVRRVANGLDITTAAAIGRYTIYATSTSKRVGVAGIGQDPPNCIASTSRLDQGPDGAPFDIPHMTRNETSFQPGNVEFKHEPAH